MEKSLKGQRKSQAREGATHLDPAVELNREGMTSRLGSDPIQTGLTSKSRNKAASEASRVEHKQTQSLVLSHPSAALKSLLQEQTVRADLEVMLAAAREVNHSHVMARMR